MRAAAAAATSEHAHLASFKPKTKAEKPLKLGFARKTLALMIKVLLPAELAAQGLSIWRRKQLISA